MGLVEGKSSQGDDMIIFTPIDIKDTSVGIELWATFPHITQDNYLVLYALATGIGGVPRNRADTVYWDQYTKEIVKEEVVK